MWRLDALTALTLVSIGVLIGLAWSEHWPDTTRLLSSCAPATP